MTSTAYSSAIAESVEYLAKPRKTHRLSGGRRESFQDVVDGLVDVYGVHPTRVVADLLDEACFRGIQLAR